MLPTAYSARTADWRSKIATLFAVLAMALSGLTGIATPAAAATGDILPPFDVNQTWNICQGYNGSVSHGGNSTYGLDLTGGPNCDNSAAGRNVRAPMAGTVAYYEWEYGNLCINVAGGRSVTLTHIDSSLGAGSSVTAGQYVGKVSQPAPAGVRPHNANVAHIHFQMWGSPGCYNSPGIPFDSVHNARICGAPDLTATGPNGGNGTWSGTTFTGKNCGAEDEVETPPATRDFNGNGKADILWYGTGSAADAIWYGSGNRTTQFEKGYDVTVNGDYVPVAGDFDGDGYGDVLWYGAGTAPDSIWYGTATKGVFSAQSIAVNGTYTPVVGDFNGNGQADILWYGSGSDSDAIWYGSSSRTTQFNKSYDVTVSGIYTPAAGDFDGDGKWDILWYGPGSDNDSMWYGTATKGVFDAEDTTVSGTYAPVVGDFNGNGQADILWYGSGSAADAIWYGSGSRATQFVKNYDVTVNGVYTPVSGDFDGDSYGDVLWYGPGPTGDSLWYGTATKGSFTMASLTVNGTYVPIVS